MIKQKPSLNKKADFKKKFVIWRHLYLVTGSVVSVLVCDRPTLCLHLHPLVCTPSNQETGNVPPQSKRLQGAQPVASFVKDLTDKHTIHGISGL